MKVTDGLVTFINGEDNVLLWTASTRVDIWRELAAPIIFT